MCGDKISLAKLMQIGYNSGLVIACCHKNEYTKEIKSFVLQNNLTHLNTFVIPNEIELLISEKYVIEQNVFDVSH